MANDCKTYTDSQLVRLIGEDHEPALRELFDRYWELLFQRANNFLHNEDAAKDCVQEVFIRLWQRRNSLDIEKVDHYLHQAVRFQAFSALRKLKAVAAFESRVAQFADIARNSSELEFRELKAFLEGLVDNLPEDQRLIFRLHREESLTYREIAEKLHISVKTVEKKMSMSLRYLRAHAGDSFVLLCVICGLK